MKESVSITLSNNSSTEELLLLEQQTYSAYLGVLTKADLAVGVTSFIYPDTTTTLPSRCGGSDNVFDTVFFVYLYEDLNYELEVSAGELGDCVIEDVEYQQIVLCSLENYVAFDYPSDGLVSEPVWGGVVYDEEGSVVTTPKYTVNDRGITFTEKVYGSITVRYMVRRHRYMFTMDKNEDVLENGYFCVAYARWTGGIKGLQVALPDNFEVTGGYCGNGSNTIHSAPDKEPKHSVSAKYDEVHYEYCSGEERYRV